MCYEHTSILPLLAMICRICILSNIYGSWMFETQMKNEF